MASYRGALFLPAQRRTFWRIGAGLYTAEGQEIPESKCWHDEKSLANVAPGLKTLDADETIPGRTLFLGAYSHHFGHRLVESTARLHGFEEGKFDQVVMFARFGEKPRALRRAMSDLMAMFGITGQKMIFPKTLVRLEEVFVPEQGWGGDVMSHGSPEFRRFARANFAQDIKPVGASKVYISRSRHNSSRGSLIAEAGIEAQFEAAGFRIFHPQEHTLAEQIAQYRAAEVIAGPDGTPFHLVALSARAETQVVIIQRRLTDSAAHLRQQLINFGVPNVTIVPCEPIGWAFAGSRRAHKTLWGECSPPLIRQALVERGILDPTAPDWPALQPEARTEFLMSLIASHDRSLCEVTDCLTRLADVPRHDASGQPRLLRLEELQDGAKT